MLSSQVLGSITRWTGGFPQQVNLEQASSQTELQPRVAGSEDMAEGDRWTRSEGEAGCGLRRRR